jgi:hypothetical protein
MLDNFDCKQNIKTDDNNTKAKVIFTMPDNMSKAI